MQYLLAIYGDETAGADVPPEAMEAVLSEWWAYNEALKAAGVFVAGEALQPTATATTVRERDGERVLTDGPFAETKEQLGGFYVLECQDLDEALEWAGRCPGVRHGPVEVRPVMVFEDMSASQAAADTAAG